MGQRESDIDKPEASLPNFTLSSREVVPGFSEAREHIYWFIQHGLRQASLKQPDAKHLPVRYISDTVQCSTQIDIILYASGVDSHKSSPAAREFCCTSGVQSRTVW